MYLRISLVLFIVRVFPLVFACEGECITGIANAFHALYFPKVHSVLMDLEKEINEKLLPPSERYPNKGKLHFLEPLEVAYNEKASSALQYDIFPRHFHGKCQRFSSDGRDPPGCPNPDCPVVCGTPGSLVHFYDDLRFIAFNCTRMILGELSSMNSDAYKNASMRVSAAAKHRTRVAKRQNVMPILHGLLGSSPNSANDNSIDSGAGTPQGIPQDIIDSPLDANRTVAPLPQETQHSNHASAQNNGKHLYETHTSRLVSKHKLKTKTKQKHEAAASPPGTTHVHHNARALPSVTHARIHARHFGFRDTLLNQVANTTPAHVEALRNLNDRTSTPTLKDILSSASEMLARACGGDVGRERNSLPECSWELNMKHYILSFP